jgi:hypothetical protein
VNSTYCEKWVAKKPLPNLPPQSVIVLDSAPFHCLLIAILSYAGKAYKVSWLCKECVVCDEKKKKKDLSVNFSNEAQEVINKYDHIMANHGHISDCLHACVSKSYRPCMTKN